MFRPRVTPTADTARNSLLRVEFNREAVDRRYRFADDFAVRTNVPNLNDLTPLGRIHARARDDNGEELVLAQHDVLIYLELAKSRQVLDCAIPARKPGLADPIREHIIRMTRAPEQHEKMTVRYWLQDQYGGGTSGQKSVPVPLWSDVAANYPVATRARVEPLMNARKAPAGGKLILWHGKPGTGKTSALRALMRAWKPWCRPDLVFDPENFFQSAEYMLDALTDERPRGWRLFILEDTGEMLESDAKHHEGQRVSRLLNTVDGLLGEGLRAFFLLTTNEPVEHLHPALTRPGRCLATVDFATFTAAEAGDWLRAHDADPSHARAGMTLADLYAAIEGREARAPKKTIGFTARV